RPPLAIGAATRELGAGRLHRSPRLQLRRVRTGAARLCAARLGRSGPGSVQCGAGSGGLVIAAAILADALPAGRMADRLAAVLRQQVTLGYIGDVAGLLVLGEQVVVGLVLARPAVLGNREPPLLGVGELGVDVEDHSPKRIDPMPDHLTELE